jgi:hypothetical protein
MRRRGLYDEGGPSDQESTVNYLRHRSLAIKVAMRNPVAVASRPVDDEFVVQPANTRIGEPGGALTQIAASRGSLMLEQNRLAAGDRRNPPIFGQLDSSLAHSAASGRRRPRPTSSCSRRGATPLAIVRTFSVAPEALPRRRAIRITQRDQTDPVSAVLDFGVQAGDRRVIWRRLWESTEWRNNSVVGIN